MDREREVKTKIAVLFWFGPLGLSIGTALVGNVAGSGMLLIIQMVIWLTFDLEKYIEGGEGEE